MNIKGHYAYLKYVVRHKWYVTVECLKRGLIMRGLLHDIDKFYPSEFFPYSRFFNNPDGSKRSVRSPTGYYKPSDTGSPEFDYAWFLHQKRNDHHWQWHIFPDDGPEMVDIDNTIRNQIKVFKMSEKAIAEMICDWIGAGKAQGVTAGINVWYETNKSKLVFHPETRARVEELLAAMFPPSQK